MTNDRAIEIINDEREIWRRIVNVFDEKSEWFKDGIEKIEAFRWAIDAMIKRKENEENGRAD